MNPETFLEWLMYAINRVGNGYFGYSERVYCYELYHFIRVAMFRYERENHINNNIFLHSELVKAIIPMERARILNINPLQGRRMPDFLYHDPTNAAHQIAAIEVKATSPLLFSEFIDDIRKLSELKNDYNYQLCIFHCINNDMDKIQELVERALMEDMILDGNILIICKPSFYSGIASQYLSSIINNRGNDG